MWEIDEADWARLLAVNVTAAWAATRAALPTQRRVPAGGPGHAPPAKQHRRRQTQVPAAAGGQHRGIEQAAVKEQAHATHAKA